MDVVVMIAYGVVAAAAVAGGIVLARIVWRKFGRGERAMVERAARDRRRRTAPVMWDRRVRPRRLEDVAKGFLEGFDARTRTGSG